MKHKLSGNLFMGTNKEQIVFLDTSTYLINPSPSNFLLDIYKPNNDTPVVVNYLPNEYNIITAEGLGECRLIDGCYRIIQSVCPNNLLLLEHTFLKTSDTKQKLSELICNVDSCELKEDCSLLKLYVEIHLAEDLIHQDFKKACCLFSLVQKEINDRYETCEIC